MKRILLIAGLLTSLGLTVNAQQDAQYSQYMFNGIYINPAYAGYKEALNLHAFYRAVTRRGPHGIDQTFHVKAKFERDRGRAIRDRGFSRRVVNRFPAFYILNAIFDAIVTLRCQSLDRFLTNTTLKFDEDFRRAEIVSLAERDIFDSRCFLLLLDGHEPAGFPTLPPFVELARKSGYENEDERQRDVDEDIVAVHGGTSLDPIILALEFVSSDLVLVRAVFVGLALGFELNAPAARDHLAAHFVVF